MEAREHLYLRVMQFIFSSSLFKAETSYSNSLTVTCKYLS